MHFFPPSSQFFCTGRHFFRLSLIGLGVAAIGCSSAAGGGGGGVGASGITVQTGGVEGAVCSPSSANEGCRGTARMVCNADAVKPTTGKWAKIADCLAAEICVESKDPAASNKKLSECKLAPVATADAAGGDATSGIDATIGEDAAATGDSGSNGGTDAAADNGEHGDVFTPPDDTFVGEDAKITDTFVPPDAGKDTLVSDVAKDSGSDVNKSDGVVIEVKIDTSGDGGGTGHFCDNNCGNPGPNSACYCDAQCIQYGDCCDATGTKKSGIICAGSTCKTCNGSSGKTFCGNSVCEVGETNASCAKDCPVAAVCGNGKCEGGESSVNCAKDCPVAACGNGKCEVGETNANCAKDCPPSQCGNGVCDPGETNATCAMDCDANPACTVFADVQPILTAKCGQCHGTTYGSTKCSSVAPFATKIGGMINGSMPPKGQPQLTVVEKAKVQLWIEQGAPCDASACP